MRELVGWSVNGQLTPLLTGGAVQLQAQFPETESYTVQFAVDGQDESGVAATRRTIATLIWSVEGNSVSRQIDVANGTSISGTAQAVQVKVTDDSTGSGLHPYTVTIQVAPGVRPTTQQPPYLSSGLAIKLPAGSGSAAVAVPQAAGAISVFVTVAPQALDAVIAEFDTLVFQNSGAGGVKAYNPRSSDWVPLSGGVTSIGLLQGAAAPATIWSVLFGIDG